MRFKEILKQCVLVAIMFGLAGSAQAQQLSQQEFIELTLMHYGNYLNKGPADENGNHPGRPVIKALGLVSDPDNKDIAPGPMVREVVKNAVATGVPISPGSLGGFSPEAVQALLTQKARSESGLVALVTSAYSFSGTAVDTASNEEYIVINLSRDKIANPNGGLRGLVVPTRLVKRLKSGEWKGFDHGSAGTVSYAKALDNDDCPNPNNLDVWNLAGDGLIPASLAMPVSCVRLSITHNGMYDADEKSYVLSDPVMGVEEGKNPDLQLAHASAGSGGGSAGVWTIMALLTVLALPMLRRRRVTVRSEL